MLFSTWILFLIPFQPAGATMRIDRGGRRGINNEEVRQDTATMWLLSGSSLPQSAHFPVWVSIPPEKLVVPSTTPHHTMSILELSLVLITRLWLPHGTCSMGSCLWGTVTHNMFWPCLFMGGRGFKHYRLWFLNPTNICFPRRWMSCQMVLIVTHGQQAWDDTYVSHRSKVDFPWNSNLAIFYFKDTFFRTLELIEVVKSNANMREKCVECDSADEKYALRDWD